MVEPSEPRRPPNVSLTLGLASLAWLVVFQFGVLWSIRIGNPVGLIVPYFAASLVAPFLSVVLLRHHPHAGKPFVIFTPVVVGAALGALVLFAGYSPLGETITNGRTLAAIELILLPVGLALAMLARWAARRGHVAEQSY